MRRLLVRVAAALVAGVLVGAAALVATYGRQAEIAFEMDGAAPRVLWGFHGPERVGDLSYAWSTTQAGVTLQGLDRRAAWTCTMRLRGARPSGVSQPSVALSIDGLASQGVAATNEFADVPLAVPPRPTRDGVVIAMTASAPFVPGGGDRRELGVQVDRIACRPDGPVRPPTPALLAASAVTAIFAASFVLLGAPLWPACAAATIVGAAQSLALVAGIALYSPYIERLVPFAAGAAIAAVAVTAALRWALGRVPSTAARFALGYSAAAFYVLIAGLVHPSKALVDAVFHAHRLEWVHAGRYFFTQPMPDGVSFPYAIALYVIASPFMALTRDHVTLLRVVVTGVHVLAGLTLYVVIARRLDDRLAGALAVALWPLVPHWHVVVGNANMTNAFGQSVATAAILLAAALLPERRSWQALALVFVLTLVAFLSHVSTFPLLALAMICVTAAIVISRNRELKPLATAIGAITVAAGLASVVVYYGHFAEVYRSLDKVRGRPAPAAQTAQPATATAVVLDPTLDPTLATTRGAPTPGTWTRLTTALGVGRRAVGWPMLLLALAGAWRLASERRLDALTLTLAGWCVAGLAFLAFGVLSPVEPRFYRYMVEFIGRVFYATWPALVVLAGLGAAWAWRAGPIGRTVTALLAAWALGIGASAWAGWFRP